MKSPLTKEDLALLLLYLNSWDDDPNREYSGGPILRAWKNIRFETLDILEEQGLIKDAKGRKPILLTKEGIAKAEELKKNFM